MANSKSYKSGREKPKESVRMIKWLTAVCSSCVYTSLGVPCSNRIWKNGKKWKNIMGRKGGNNREPEGRREQKTFMKTQLLERESVAESQDLPPSGQKFIYNLNNYFDFNYFCYCTNCFSIGLAIFATRQIFLNRRSGKLWIKYVPNREERRGYKYHPPRPSWKSLNYYRVVYFLFREALIHRTHSKSLTNLNKKGNKRVSDSPTVSLIQMQFFHYSIWAE